ncbi:MAG: energy-coupling factor ABC transporter ATP-binding protein, partial [Bacilli bacterium]
MISVKNVHFKYPGGTEWVLKGIDVTIQKGTFVAIMGSNGSGKTTLCKLFNGIIPHFFSGELTGEIKVNGKNTTLFPVSVLGRDVGYVYQDYENSIVRPTVMDEVQFAALNFGFEDYAARAERSLALLGLSHIAQDFVWQLSGGQKHLVALASALAVSPEYLVIDEPVAQLDPHHAHKLYETLKVLNEKHGITIIVIEHHTEFIASFCKEAILLRDGRVVMHQSAREVLCNVQELHASDIFPPQVTQ